MKKLLLCLFFLPLVTVAQCWEEISAGNSHTIGMKNDHTLWSWGRNDRGQIGDGTTINRDLPTQVGTDSDWQDFSSSTGGSSMAIKQDGTLWGWGWLDVGGYHIELSPMMIGNENDWLQVVCGTSHTLLLKTNGTLWAFGDRNDYGQLGSGSTTINNFPLQIGNDQNWTKIATWTDTSYAIKSDGTLWTWGRNDYGQVGDGTNTNRYIPTQVGVENDWLNVSCGAGSSFAIKTNGTLWAWGWNQYGNLGNGTMTHRNTPMQIGTDENWGKISSGTSHTMGIKTDGTLWGWGSNSPYGPLGQDYPNNHWEPIQIGNETNWSLVSAGSLFSIAMKLNGTLFSCGYDNFGQLGIGNTPNSSDNSQHHFVPVSCIPLDTTEFTNLNKITVYPNPTAAVLTIQNEGNLPIQHIAVIDQLGKVVLEQTNDFTTVNLASLQNGLYMLQITTDREKVVYKVVKR